jgi:hypothetical protein
LVSRNIRKKSVEAGAAADLLVNDLGEKALEGDGKITEKNPEGILLEGDVSVQDASMMRLIVEGAVVQRTWVAGKLQPDTQPTMGMGVNRVTLWLLPTSGTIRWQLAAVPKSRN